MQPVSRTRQWIRLQVCGALIALAPVTAAWAKDDVRETYVGLPAVIEQIVLPGVELEPKPLEDRSQPIVLRIVQVYPHGSDHRYDLTYYGLEPGEYNLTDFLQRVDGSPTDDLPSLQVTIKAGLPPGQVEPNALPAGDLPEVGGYRLWVRLGWILWLAGLIVLFCYRRRRESAGAAVEGRPASLSEQLRPLVKQARAGTLTPADQARLERLLVDYWRQRLNLEQVSANEAMQRIRQDDEARLLFEQLDRWLHRPATDALDERQLNELLSPYESLPATAETASSETASSDS